MIFFTAGCSSTLSPQPASTSPAGIPSVVSPPADSLPTSVTALSSQTPADAPRTFRVIGYATESIIVETIPFDRLTHINYAFLVPNADGTFAPLANSWKIKKLVSRGHQAGIKILISIGGWGWDKEFEQAAGNIETRSAFIENALKIVDEYGFDGIDIDWEYPVNGISSANYLTLMQDLRKALDKRLLTTAVIAYGDETGSGIPAEVFDLVDFLNVMAYDGPDHASLQQFQNGLDYWLKRGIPKEKLVMGIPFYSRPGELSFKKLVEFNPEAANSDRTLVYGKEQIYNGIRTVKEKTTIARNSASGIMFWTLEQDAGGDNSLLLAIHEVITNK